jgi:riboflavin biosynthesis protein RibD
MLDTAKIKKMALHPIFMYRCLQLARKGEGFTKPNPMVGAVIVHKNNIIGEGYHRQYGGAHAEVNAIASVKDESLLTDSTLYVSLEPCAHHGKTPPCAELIISKKIPRVVVAVTDPNPKVSGKGIEMLRENGIEVTVGLLEEKARILNRFFFVNQLYSRPYVILKWAQSNDGFMDHHRVSREDKTPAIISNNLTHSIVHKYRTHIEGILVGTNTVVLDNPQLTARKWYGEHPTRVVIDRVNRIPADSAVFDGTAPTIVFTSSVPDESKKKEHAEFILIDFSKETNRQILTCLYEKKIYSLLVEGGAMLLSSFIDKNMWDEAFIEISGKRLFSGIKAPDIQGRVIRTKKYLDASQIHLKSEITRNFL